MTTTLPLYSVWLGRPRAFLSLYPPLLPFWSTWTFSTRGKRSHGIAEHAMLFGGTEDIADNYLAFHGTLQKLVYNLPELKDLGAS